MSRPRAAFRRVAPLVTALGLLAAGCTHGLRRDTAEDAAPRLVVHYFNDWHGHLEPFQRHDSAQPVAGAARLARLLGDRRAAAEASGADTLLFVAGDILQGTPMSTAFRGEPDFALLQRFGVTAMALGNHEFDFGVPNLEERMGQVDFPILAANVRRQDGSLFAGDTVTVTTPRHGLRVAVLGLVTADTKVTTHPRNVADLTFADEVETARRYVPRLAAESDMVVIVSHSGSWVDKRLAAIPGVDLVVGGHDQKLLDPAVMVRGVPVVQAFEWGEILGEAVFAGPRRSGDRGVRFVANRYQRVTPDLPEDPEVAAFVAGYRARLSDELGKVVTVSSVRLDGDRVRDEETNLGNMVADAILQASGAEIGVINGGAIRASIEPGNVTLEHLMTALPFDNHVVIVELTGAEVLSMLRQSIVDPGAGAFLQVAGLRVRHGSDGELTATVGDEPLDPARRYRLATSDFLVAGGDGYEQAMGKPVVDTGLVLLDVVLRWIELQGSPLAVEEDGRLLLPEDDALPSAA
jgi:5'-nucleotidase/UDP-sugar diphosphatase